MGCCAVRLPKNPKSAVTTASNVRDLNSQREDLLSKIFGLHNLILSCNNQIEIYLIDTQKDLALLLKSKKFCIKEKSKELQNLISRIDEVIEENPENKFERNEIKSEIHKIKLELEGNLIYDSKVVFDDKDNEHVRKLKIEMEEFEVDQIGMLKEIEQELAECQKKTDERGTVVRRKYVKARKTA